ALITPIANRLEAQRHGTLAVISSVAEDRGRPSNYLYGSAKAALQAFLEGMRARLFKAGVHCVDVRPCSVVTPMTAALPLLVDCVIDLAHGGFDVKDRHTST
ncbi:MULTISPECIES: SDR family NAD(P)-dependent oxidoreductase, partial [unclassified Caballeronia]|uniref:SDR family NAD(P)-dependent oxidoreductase n=1 Tax=unclassified Caballeronia TaxID=2646786 RepID=UPI0020285EB8